VKLESGRIRGTESVDDPDSFDFPWDGAAARELIPYRW
jgi:hypothetical protein